MQDLDDIIIKYNGFVSPTQEELAAVAQYVPAELIVTPMAYVTWLSLLSFAKKERQDRINAVANRISGVGDLLTPEENTALNKWVRAQAAAKAHAAQAAEQKMSGATAKGFEDAILKRSLIGQVKKF